MAEQNRIQFVRYSRSELRNDAYFFKGVVFSEEVKSLLSGFVTKQHSQVWCLERPNNVHQVPSSGPSIVVWGAVSKTHVAGPFSKRKCDGRGLQSASSVLCVSQTLRVRKRQDFSTGWCFSSLLCSCASVLEGKVPQPLAGDSWPHFRGLLVHLI